ncbi:hypothetical protein [Siphonobacter sp. BAB-5385]|uniref:hypothetical protein n=1 Tax=Siphonobacter sp. BAB-5385 TaxID=1864822 RepID=UPI001596126E|nr:hypothetical protein [Siphonobacter sp. BAB-5385]
MISFLLLEAISSRLTAQTLLVQPTLTWTKTSLVNPHDYKAVNRWGTGKQIDFWFRLNNQKRTRFLGGALVGDRKMYMIRRYPAYEIMPLMAQVTRKDQYVTFALMVEQQLHHWNKWEWTASLGIGSELLIKREQTALVQPGGAAPSSINVPFFSSAKAVGLLRTSIVYRFNPRFNLGLEGTYSTQIRTWFSTIYDRSVPQTIGVNMKASYSLGHWVIPEVK